VWWQAEARVKAEAAKKKGGKGLSVLNGKELFAFNAALFIDDDAAIDATEEKELEEQGRKEREREEQEEAMERARAQVRLHSAAPVQTIYHPPTHLLRITSPHMYIKRRTASLSPL
jgi:hypothetical protein